MPMLAYAPGLIEPGTRITQMVQNIDIAPTLLDAAGIETPPSAKMDGQSFFHSCPAVQPPGGTTSSMSITGSGTSLPRRPCSPFAPNDTSMSSTTGSGTAMDSMICRPIRVAAIPNLIDVPSCQDQIRTFKRSSSMNSKPAAG